MPIENKVFEIKQAHAHATHGPLLCSMCVLMCECVAFVHMLLYSLV